MGTVGGFKELNGGLTRCSLPCSHVGGLGGGTLTALTNNVLTVGGDF